MSAYSVVKGAICWVSVVMPPINEYQVELHFTLAFYFSAHYSSNNGLDHNLQFSHLADAQSDLQQVHSI